MNKYNNSRIIKSKVGKIKWDSQLHTQEVVIKVWATCSCHACNAIKDSTIINLLTIELDDFARSEAATSPTNLFPRETYKEQWITDLVIFTRPQTLSITSFL